MVPVKKSSNESSIIASLFEELIRQQAYQFYVGRDFDSKEGDQMADWLNAEGSVNDARSSLQNAIKGLLSDTGFNLPDRANEQIQAEIIKTLSQFCDVSQDQKDKVIAEGSRMVASILSDYMPKNPRLARQEASEPVLVAAK